MGIGVEPAGASGAQLGGGLDAVDQRKAAGREQWRRSWPEGSDPTVAQSHSPTGRRAHEAPAQLSGASAAAARFASGVRCT